jgi:polysaccharide export outer membrane protein
MKSRILFRALAVLVLAGSATFLHSPAGLAVEAAPGEGRPLRISSSTEGSQEVLLVEGAGAESHELTLEPGGVITVRFPGATLEAAEAGEAGPALPVAFSAPDTFVIPTHVRLVGLASGEAAVRFYLVQGSQATTTWSAYRLGVGDRIRVDIYGDEVFREREMRIVDDGTIAIPYLGDIAVAGLTVTEAAEVLSRRLAAGYLVDPKVLVEVIEYESQWVDISGQVETPGRFYLQGPTRLVDIIARAGGLKREAGTEVRLTRPGVAGAPDQVWTYGRDSLYLTGDSETNPFLESGDRVSVSSEEFFFIKGEVKSPGRYALDDNTTILKAISLAGGFEQYANHKKVELLRKQGDETIRMVINVGRIENRKEEDVQILPGDMINVRARFL